MDPMQWLKDDIDKIEAKMEAGFVDLNVKVDELLKFKWKIVGGTILASLILTGLFQIGLALIQRS